MTPDPKLDNERAVLSALAASIVATTDRAARDHAMPPMATATALIAAACFIAEREVGKAGMLDWLEGQFERPAGRSGRAQEQAVLTESGKRHGHS